MSGGFDSYEEFPASPFEVPVRPTVLREMLEGQQIGRLTMLHDPNPFGGRQFGLELTSSARLVFMAVPEQRGSEYRWRLRWTLFEAMKIITPSMVRHFARDRHALGEDPPNALQQRIEGDIIRGAPSCTDVNEDQGEVIRLEMLSGATVEFHARPGNEHWTATCQWRWRRGRHRHVVFMGGAGPRPSGGGLIVPGG